MMCNNDTEMVHISDDDIMGLFEMEIIPGKSGPFKSQKEARDISQITAQVGFGGEFYAYASQDERERHWLEVCDTTTMSFNEKVGGTKQMAVAIDYDGLPSCYLWV
jgi:hypothetical protein